LSKLSEGDTSVEGTLINYLRLMMDHLNQHMEKEDRILFPQAMDLGNINSSRGIEDIEVGAHHDEWIKVINELRLKY